MDKRLSIRPDWFTLEAYNELKDKGVHDIEIYEDMLFVCLKTFIRFKKEIGATRTLKGGVKQRIDYESVVKMKRQGVKTRDIAVAFECAPKTISNILWKSRKQGLL